MIEWFKNLSSAEKIAIVVPVGLAAIGGLFALFKWLLEKKKDPDLTLQIIDNTLKENKQLRQTIKLLEEQLSKPSLETSISPEKSIPVPSKEAKDLAAQIEDDAGPYAQALKAIAEGNNEKADELLDETQRLLDHVQQRKDEAQAKIYMARIQNASYAGWPQDALQYCDKLKPLAGNDSLILNKMSGVYYENAKYKEAKPLMERALKIDEKSFGPEHPNVAIRLNNLAQLYQATNRFKEAEPLMERALKIYEKSFGPEHPNVALALNNLAQLYKATNRFKEAEPLMERALKIDEKSLGPEHPDVARDLNNLALLYHATNRLKEAEPLMERHLVIFLQFTRRTGHPHPHLEDAIKNYTGLLMQIGYSKDEVDAQLKRLAPEMFK